MILLWFFQGIDKARVSTILSKRRKIDPTRSACNPHQIRLIAIVPTNQNNIGTVFARKIYFHLPIVFYILFLYSYTMEKLTQILGAKLPL